MRNKKLLRKYYSVMGLFILAVPVVFILLNYSLLFLHHLIQHIKSLLNPGLESTPLHEGFLLTNFYLIFFCSLFLLVIFGSRFFKRTIERINRIDNAVKIIAQDESFPEKLDTVENSEDEINKLTQSINILIDRLRYKEMLLDEHSKYKREYLKQLSHDINTPLTALNLELYQLSKDYQLPEKEISAVYDKVNYISELVKKVTEAEQFDIYNHYIFKENIVVPELLKKSLMKWKYLLDQKGIIINYEQKNNISWQGEELWLERLFDNILSNIYSHSGTKYIDIQIDHFIMIKDYGIGYPLEEQAPPDSGIGVITEICRRFNIDINITSDSKGTKYSLKQKISNE